MTEEPLAPELPLLTLREGLPDVVDTPEALARSVAALASGAGPIAIDAERASGYRYSPRAYLIQLRRAGSGTHLVDPAALPDLSGLAEVLAEEEWILHAATQDLPCLREVGLEPPSLFDTELAARLLGYPRVGLATLVEEICGYRMRKEHSAADWSTRPLPDSWVEYAALDVEVLDEIRDRLWTELGESGKAEWAQQEFAHLLTFRPLVRQEPWRRTSSLHQVRGRRGLAAVRELWVARDQIARDQDVSPSRLIPDSAIVAAARAMPTGRRALLETPGFQGRGAGRYSATWIAALDAARALPERDLPTHTLRTDAPPPPRVWADKDPIAAERFAASRTAIIDLSEQLSVPVENLMTPDTVRRILWRPPQVESADMAAAVRIALASMHARPWQIGLVGEILIQVITQIPGD